MNSLNYDEVGVLLNGYRMIAINTSHNTTEQLEQVIEWCKETEGVRREGQMVYLTTDEHFVMFRLVFG